MESPTSVTTIDNSHDNQSKHHHLKPVPFSPTNTMTSHATKESSEDGIAAKDNVNTNMDDGISHVRSLIFRLTAAVGNLCSTFLSTMPLDPPFTDEENDDMQNTRKDCEEGEVDKEVTNGMVKVLMILLEITHSLSLSLEQCIYNKMELNNKKYPVELCKGKAGKYTQYSDVTGITKTHGQSTIIHNQNEQNLKNQFAGATDKETVSSFINAIDTITVEIRNFAIDRQWSRYHKPRNLLLALTGEMGELAELVQWNGDHDHLDSISSKDMDKISQELADVTIYLLRLADVCHVDLQAQALLLQNIN